jgi:FkbM family methyltransferase
MFYSQQQEDIILWKKCLNYRNGFFLELGAMDGIVYSNTKYFEDSLSWTGILIEPEPNQFKRLVSNRPKCKNFNYAVSETDGDVVFYSRNGGDSGGGIKETHIETNLYGKEHEIVVKSKPIRNIIEEAGRPEKIDLFVIDVEGGEHGVLTTFDWSIPVYVVVIEFHANNSRTEECRKILTENGFVFDMNIGCNEVWMNHKFPKGNT